MRFVTINSQRQIGTCPWLCGISLVAVLFKYDNRFSKISLNSVVLIIGFVDYIQVSPDIGNKSIDWVRLYIQLRRIVFSVIRISPIICVLSDIIAHQKRGYIRYLICLCIGNIFI